MAVDRFRQLFVLFIASLGLVAFITGIVLAGYFSLAEGHSPTDMNEFFKYLVTGGSAVLATNLGALLGIEMKTRREGRTRALAPKTIFQMVAAAVYVAGLVAAVVLWGLTGFEDSETEVVPLLPEMARTAIGMVFGVMSVALGAGE